MTELSTNSSLRLPKGVNIHALSYLTTKYKTRNPSNCV